MRKRLQQMRYPRNQEQAYTRYLRSMVRLLRAKVKEHVASIVDSIVEEALDKDLPSGAIRQDAGWWDQLIAALRKVERDMLGPEQNVIDSLKTLGQDNNKHNLTEWRRLIRSAYGVNPAEENPERFQNLLEDWALTNARLIRSVPAKVTGQIAEAIQEALLEGKSIKETKDDIYDILDDRIDVSDSRIELIARDQVAKLNGQLTRERQEDAGVERYIWRTVGDERVRDSHVLVDGHEFDWSNPPIETDGNHPGEDFQCRCWAEPLLPDRMAFEAQLIEEEMEPV